MIKQLPPEIVSKIAAGEVIERPAYALKELLENALDAGAKSIEINLEESGLQKLAVHDNGSGMSVEDLKMSFLPHTTSKFTEESEFSGIQTLGFRGEALHSISVTGRLKIQSRLKGEVAGYEIVVEKGKLISSRKLGMPEGTSVIVEDLFGSTPVRKKFFKSAQTELRFLLEIVTDTALAWPNVSFRVTHNKKLVMDIPAGKEEERLGSLFGGDATEHLLPVLFEDGDVLIKGFISKPLAERLPQTQFFVVNKRRVDYQLFSSRVKRAYGSLLEPRRYPFTVFTITLPHHYVDVNIHPRKEQIHILNEEEIAGLLENAIVKTLQERNLTYRPEGDMLHDGGTKTYAARRLRNEVEPWGNEFTHWKASGDVLQVHNLYLFVQTKQGVMLVDQHAAHERILYEQYLEEFEKQKGKQETLTLKKAVIFETGFGEAETIREHLEELQQLGFDIEEFGTNLFKLNAVPKLFQDRDTVALLLEVVADFQAGLGTGSLDEKSHRMISYLACRTAIKGGDKITKEQAKELIKKLEECKSQYTCPHGRPVKAEISTRELERLFHRR